MGVAGILAGAGLMAGGQVMQGQAAKTEGKNMETLANYNASVAEMAANEEERTAAYKAEAQQKEAQRFLAKQRTLYNRAGVYGESPIAVLNDSAYELDLDRMMLRREGTIRGSQLRASAVGERLRGKAAKRAGKTAFNSSLLSAGGTMLTGFGLTGLGKVGQPALTPENQATLLRY